jgi:hypothetical protein
MAACCFPLIRRRRDAAADLQQDPGQYVGGNALQSIQMHSMCLAQSCTELLPYSRSTRPLLLCSWGTILSTCILCPPSTCSFMQGARCPPVLAGSSTLPGALTEPRGWSSTRLSHNEPCRGLGHGPSPMLGHSLQGATHGGGDLLTHGGDNASGATAPSGVASAARGQSPLAAVPKQLLGKGAHSLVYFSTWNAAQVVAKVNGTGREPSV